ncbi:lactonase family protein [Candidatus Latescibacterota bacterium]
MSFRAIIAAVCIFAFASLVSAEIIPFYIATSISATSPSQGIYRSTLDTATGRLSDPVLATKAPSTSFIAIHSNGDYLYTVSRPSDQPEGAVNAYAIDKSTGNLKPINEQTSGGDGPNHLSIDQSGKFVLLNNYRSGSIQSVPIQADGSLGKPAGFVQHEGSSVNPQRQAGPHAHCIYASPDNRRVYVTDLGLDKTLIYQFDSTKGTFTPNNPPFAQSNPGVGPRHFIFHTSGRFLYVINELEGSITGYTVNASNGALSEIETLSTFPEGYTGATSSAEIFVTPNGRFLYGSNRGNHTIAVFQVDQNTGRLTFVEHESASIAHPGNFAIDPTGAFLIVANRNGNSISCYRINQETGALDIAGPISLVPSPSCVMFAR